MSVVACRAAMETALNSMSPALATAWEGQDYKPVVGTPFQRVAVRLADPEPLEQSGKWHRERGYLQVTLFYPGQTGPGAAEARADLLRGTFYRGATFSASGVTVFAETPAVYPPLPDDDWRVVPVRIPFYAHIARS